MKETIFNNMKKYKNRDAIISRQKTISYKELYKIILENKSWYEKNYGNKIIGIAAGNTWEVIAILLLALITKGKVVLLGDNIKREEYEYYIENLNLQAVFVSKSKIKEFLLEEKESFFFGSLASFFYPKRNLNEAEYYPEDYIIQLTSGSMGISKAVARSECSLKKEILSTYEAVDFKNDYVFMVIPPIAHSYGLVIGVLLPLYLGKTVLLVEEFNPDLVENYLIRYEVNVLIGVPYIYHILNRRKNIGKNHYLTKCFSAGAPLNATEQEKFRLNTGLTIWNDYGSTETGVICIEKKGTTSNIGKPVPGMTLCILDQDGKEVEHGAAGLIYIKSENVSRGYVFPKSLNKEKYRNGMYCTGDIGIIEPDGNVRLCGRNDDFIIVGGEKTSATEIEKKLLRMEEIKSAIVMSEKNAITGDIICAYVECKKGKKITEKDIIKFCNENMENYKIPKKIYFIDEVPRNNTGKILRKYLSNYGGKSDEFS